METSASFEARSAPSSYPTAKQSVDLAYDLEKTERLRGRPGFFESERTGERGTERDSAVVAAILSAPDEVGSHSRLPIATTLLRRNIATCDESKETA